MPPNVEIARRAELRHTEAMEEQNTRPNTRAEARAAGWVSRVCGVAAWGRAPRVDRLELLSSTTPPTEAPMKFDTTEENINYLQGQIDGLKALTLGLANLLLDREEFRQEGLLRLELQRTAFVASLEPDSRLDGIEAIDAWLLNVTQQ